MPPTVERFADDGIGGKNIPCSATRSSTALPITPGSTSIWKSSGRTSSTASIFVMSMLMPSNSGTALPSIDVPAAYGVTGTSRSLAAESTVETSAVDFGQTTAFGRTPRPASWATQSAAWLSRAASSNDTSPSRPRSDRNEQS